MQTHFKIGLTSQIIGGYWKYYEHYQAPWRAEDPDLKKAKARANSLKSKFRWAGLFDDIVPEALAKKITGPFQRSKSHVTQVLAREKAKYHIAQRLATEDCKLQKGQYRVRCHAQCCP